MLFAGSTSTVSRTLGRLLVLGCVALGTVACGTLVPPVEVAPTDTSKRSLSQPLTLAAEEGRPQGLLLRIGADASPDVDEVALYRRTDGDEPERLKTIPLDELSDDRLTGEGVTFLDRSVPAGGVAYQLRAPTSASSDGSTSGAKNTSKASPAASKQAEKAADTESSSGDTPESKATSNDPKTDETETRPVSPLLRVQWVKPPPKPKKLRGEARTPAAVELQWQFEGHGVLIFRRDVLDRSAELRPLTRLGPDSRGLFVDRDVRPGGVYAYRLARVDTRGPFPRYGPPSRTIYVSVPKME